MGNLDTATFGLTRVGKGEDISKNGYKALDKDRLTLDSVLAALAQHTHAGETALSPADVAPTAVLASSGGSLPPGVTFYYSVGYLDKFGLETSNSPQLAVSTIAATASPSSILLSQTTGGSLVAGLYSYAVTFVQTTGGETTSSSAYSITTDGTSGQSAIFMSFPSLPDPSTTYRIYRSRPGQSQLYYLADTSSQTYTDTGASEDSTRVTPNFNTTNAFQKITLTIPGTSAAPGSVPPGVKGWRIYRTESSGQFRGANLVHEVVEPTTQGGTDLRVTWDDTSISLLNGAPNQNNATFNMPPSLGYAAFRPEIATTNLVTNPSFELNTTGWTLVDATSPSSTLTRVKANAVGGAYSAQVVSTLPNKDAYLTAQFTVSANTTYTVSAYSYMTSWTANALNSRGMYITDGTTVVSTNLTNAANQLNSWYRHQATMVTSNSATVITIRLYVPQATTNWDSVQGEAASTASAYCDGSLGDGYAWTGTAHASTSTRAYGKTVIPSLTVLDTLSSQSSFVRGEWPATTLSHNIGGGTTGIKITAGPNGGTDSGFLLYQDDSTLDLNDNSTNASRLSLGVMNVFGQAGGDELWLQGSNRTVINAGTYDSELVTLLGSQTSTAFAATQNVFELRVNNTAVVSLQAGGNFSLGQHLSATGTTTTIAAGAGAGTSPPTPTVASSNDIRGTASFGTGTTPAANSTLVTVSFAAGYAAAPVVVITPKNQATAALGLFVIGTATGNFTVASNTAPAASQGATVYSFSYMVVG